MAERVSSTPTIPFADHAKPDACDSAVARLALQLKEAGWEGLSERERRVFLRVIERRHGIRDASGPLAKRDTFGERLADRVATLGGSWGFILVFTGTLGACVVANTVSLNLEGGINPYPYVSLNLILSMVAALQAPVILMSLNRRTARNRSAAASAHETNLRRGIEIMALHDEVDRIGMERLEDLLTAQAAGIAAIAKAIAVGTVTAMKPGQAP